jgi:hypothetical protein
VIATKTKLDISGLKLPANINDKYFKRSRQKHAKKVEGDIFSTKKEVRNNISDRLLAIFVIVVEFLWKGYHSLIVCCGCNESKSLLLFQKVQSL